MSTPLTQRELIEQAFLLGFMASREGFTADYAFDHCAPSRLELEDRTEAELLAHLEAKEAWTDLRAEAVRRLAGP